MELVKSSVVFDEEQHKYWLGEKELHGKVQSSWLPVLAAKFAGGFLSLLGGLALFLYGMTMLGDGLEKLSGGRLEQTLERLTNTTWKGVLLGALVTGAIQSSSATTVIVVGLVNARMLKLRQAIGIIMGANIGTTITAHILRLSDLESENFFLQLLKPHHALVLLLQLPILVPLLPLRPLLLQTVMPITVT